ncbi:hypothetical protein SNE40_009951 [Patella caerulea]
MTGWNVSASSTNNSDSIYADDSELDTKLFGRIIAAIMIMFIPFILGGNLIVLIAVMSFVKLQTVTNYFVVSLAFADLLVGAGTIPLYAVFHLQTGNVVENKTACLIRYALVVESCGASLLNLLFISIDRFIAVIYPLRYYSLVTPKRAKVSILILWIYITFVSLLPTMGWNLWNDDSVCDFYEIFPKAYVVISSFLLISVCICLATLMYVRIFLEAKRQHKKMVIETAHRSTSIKRRLERDLSSAKAMATVLLMFVIFWLPYLASAPFRFSPYMSNDLINVIKDFALCLSMSNSMINPMIYALLRKDFRAAFKQVLQLKLTQLRTASKNGNKSDNSNSGVSLKNTPNSEMNLTKMTNSIPVPSVIGVNHICEVDNCSDSGRESTLAVL